MDYIFRQATLADHAAIWEIISQAILRRKADGSKQWQDGYPNPTVIQSDITRGIGYVLVIGEEIVGYTAILINDEPAYDELEGTWLTTGDFVVFHRVAIAEQQLGKGLAKLLLHHIEEFALQQGIYSVKADTNFDNPGMLKTFEKQGYVYCGEVTFRGAKRKAYEKVLR
ncbi:GNAT family N-acetyltransferase [Sphingobacterium psychroaquaticum]|uniref:L-amino acid N-acyltransferase YncA n=1 Tax=Sphingobacterium psychroaquaticum TaxID=561061 RepID=A0A1X7LAZ7_9SPHI|nr:GNAT family N-acetyltransferase [Sphingobacterium psychroaquaticum]QBQ40433.1 GNAT family N-acetyltransferase [Sphingobacterium psychroaquaticum]SMG51016.1 L-amino acid N-acyltransferase YncA [Sphingobacterium psychroaquaticum]